MFHHIQDSDSRIIIHGEIAIRRILQRHQFRRNHLRILTIVTDANYRLINLHTVLQQSILISVKTVLRDFQLHRRPVESNTLASRFYQVAHRVESPHIVIHHHAAGINTRTDAIIEYQGNARVNQSLEMIIALGVLRLRDDDATDLLPMEHLTDAGLAFKLLVTQRYHDVVAMRHSRLLNTCQNGRKIIVGKLWHDDTNHLRGHHTAMT